MRSAARGTGSTRSPHTPPPAASRAAVLAVPHAWTVLVALVALAVYLVECPAVSGDKDSAEFTLVLALAGAAHPTGYPVFTLVGHGFVTLLHALGARWAWAANAFTAVGGATAMYLLHRLGLALLSPTARMGRGARFGLALLPVALFAFNPIWTYETTLAEVYAWHVAWCLGAALAFVHLARGIAADAWTRRGLALRAAAWGALCGLGGAHHVTALFVAAPLSIALAWMLAARRRLAWELAPLALLAACVPLSSYGFLLWRASHPAAAQWPDLGPGLAGLLEHVTGAKYRHYLGRFAPSTVQRGFLAAWVWPFLFPALACALLAAAVAKPGVERALRAAVALAALLGTVYAFNYGVEDPSSYFLYPMTFGLAAVAPLLAWLLAGGPAARRAGQIAAAALAALALALSIPWLSLNQRRVVVYTNFDGLVRRMWHTIPADSGFVFWANDMYVTLREYQLLEHERPGLDVMNPYLLLNPRPRARFVARYGFDPAEGLLLHAPSAAVPDLNAYLLQQASSQVEEIVNRRTALPVFHFDPGVPTLRLLKKAGAARDSTGASADSARAQVSPRAR